MTKLTFTTKEEYLAYRAEWKAAYKRIAKDSRETKSQRKQFIWKYREKDQNALPRKTKVGVNPNYDEYACSRVMSLRWQAREMLKELAEAKVMAGEQRQARLEREQKAA